MKQTKMYQAGYAYGNTWFVCGYGKTLVEARASLATALKTANIFAEGLSYVESFYLSQADR